MGELYRVADEIEQNLAQTADVSEDEFGNLLVAGVSEIESFFASAWGEQRDAIGYALTNGQGMRFESDLTRFDFGEIENIVDEREKSFAGELDGLNIFVLLGG